MEYWFADGKRYFGCDHTAWGKDGSTSNVTAIESRSFALAQAKVERNVVPGHDDCKGKVTSGKQVR
jgi:hypothetical protein